MTLSKLFHPLVWIILGGTILHVLQALWQCLFSNLFT